MPVPAARDAQFTLSMGHIGENMTGDRQSLSLLNKTSGVDEALGCFEHGHGQLNTALKAVEI